ncbi:MAG TPA: hypothetical protein VK631_20150 [Solirubrobacteraceae bacterium]|nr:hypothetical protein [Solirubrobacteraceae bacterium]
MGLLALMIGMGVAPAASARERHGFRLEEATIAEIQQAISRRQVTTTEIVKG